MMSTIFERNPFVGPRALQQGEKLYGRDTEISDSFHRLQARRIVVLHSPSGAGKSSLVQAGLIPRLLEEGYDVWNTIRINLDPQGLGVPQETNRYVLSAMVSLEEDEAIPLDRRRGPTELAGLTFHQYLQSRPRRADQADRPVVLLFDQFEEVLTVAPRDVEGKQELFAQLGRALSHGSYWALFIIREDYLAALAPYRDRIPTQLSNTFRIDLLDREKAREVAEQLARRGGREFPGVEKLVRDLSTVQVQQVDGSFSAEQGQYVEPVLLQVVCHQLWAAMPEDDLSIDDEDIERYAGISKALSGYYAKAVGDIAKDDSSVERSIREWMGSKLIVGGIRSQVRQELHQSAGLDNEIIEQLRKVYLVRAEQRAGATWFELSHDRMLEPIQRSNEEWEQKYLHALGEHYPKTVQDIARGDAALERSIREWMGSKLIVGGIRSQVRQELRQSAGLDNEIIEQLREVFLVRTEQRGGVTWFELSHHRLMEPILRNNEDWEQENLHPLQVQVKRWENEQRPQKLLLEGEALLDAEEWERVNHAWVTEVEREYLEQARALRALRKEEAEAERRKLLVKRRRVQRVVTATAVTIAIVFFGLFAWAMRAKGMAEHAQLEAEHAQDVSLRERREAETQRGRARDALWLSYSWRFEDSDPTRALLGLRNVASIETIGWMQRALDAVQQQITRALLLGHESDVHSVSFSPNGQRVVTASKDRTARIWNADGTGFPVILHGHEDAVLSASFSPDGQRVVTASFDRTARIWNVDGSGSPVVLRGHEDAVPSASFSPNGQRVVTASADGTARIWSADGTDSPVVLGHESTVLSASFSPDGVRVATTSADGTARIWNVDGSDSPIVLRGHEDSVVSASFSPDGQRVVTASRDETARIWNVDGTGSPVVLRGHESAVLSASFSPDGQRVVTASRDHTARIWYVDGSDSSVVLRGHESAVLSTSFSPDGQRVVTASRDYTARIWYVDGSDSPIVLRGHEDSVVSASFSPDGQRVVTASEDDTARIWNDPGCPEVLRDHEGTVLSASFSPDDKRVVTASSDRTARIWNVDGASSPVVLRGHEDSVVSASFSPDGQRVVTASDDDTARIWNVDGSGFPIVLRGHERPVLSASFSPDGVRVVTASDDGTARIWNVDGSGSPVVLLGHEDAVVSASFGPDGQRIVTASFDATARIWDVDGSGSPVVLRDHVGAVLSAGFDRYGQRVVTASDDDTARIWNVDGSGSPIVLRGHEGDVFSASFSPDGQRVVTASADGTARIWRVIGTDSPVVLRGHEDSLVSASFSPDGKRVVTASKDHTARIWNVDGTGSPVILRGHEDSVVSAGFSPDGKRIVTPSKDQTVRIWTLDPAILSQLLKTATSACIPSIDRIQYAAETPDEACQAFTACEREHGRPGKECPQPSP